MLRSKKQNDLWFYEVLIKHVQFMPSSNLRNWFITKTGITG